MRNDSGRIWQDIDKAYRGNPPGEVLAHGWQTDPEVLAEMGELVGVQWCDDHKLAWTDGGDCWAAGVGGIDACRIRVRKLVWVVPEEASDG